MKQNKNRIISALLALVLTVSINPFLPQAHAEEYHIGDIITFGTYEQNNNRKDGPEDIEWIVLDQKDDRLLLISRFCIDCKPYHSSLEPVTWETSSLRKWLNHDFIDKAFSEEEQNRILTVRNENPAHIFAKTSSGRDTDDQVFILTMEEAKELFSSYSSRQAKPTAYAIAQGAYVNPDNQMTWWWLRTTSYQENHVTFATSGGDVSVEGRAVNRQNAGVRPVMWISTGSAQASIGEVSSGRCGENLTYTLSADDVLTISGTGDMYNWDNAALGQSVTHNPAPWFDLLGKITSVVITDGVTSIGTDAFSFCVNLSSVTIPNSVTSISSDAFRNCLDLTSITIPHSVTSIGDRAFLGCTSLASITIPDSVTSIGSYAFYDSPCVTSIFIPDSVTSIGEEAFSWRDKLTSVIIPDDITSIGSFDYSNYYYLSAVSIPNSVTSIDSGAFSGCFSLDSITIPDSVTCIGGQTFQNCYSLKFVALPSTITAIDRWTFASCKSLTSITIPDGVTSIGFGAFSGCSSLISITIPDSITAIGDKAFDGCNNLVITLQQGSYAEQYCKDNALNYRYAD